VDDDTVDLSNLQRQIIHRCRMSPGPSSTSG
jgi:molybdopterin/thiamine biosynthesis adenylyltransferase